MVMYSFLTGKHVGMRYWPVPPYLVASLVCSLYYVLLLGGNNPVYNADQQHFRKMWSRSMRRTKDEFLCR